MTCNYLYQVEVRQGDVKVDYVTQVYRSKDVLILSIATSEKYTRVLATGGTSEGNERKIMIGTDTATADYSNAAMVTIKGAFGDFDIESAETQKHRVIWTLCRSEHAQNVWVRDEDL